VVGRHFPQVRIPFPTWALLQEEERRPRMLNPAGVPKQLPIEAFDQTRMVLGDDVHHSWLLSLIVG